MNLARRTADGIRWIQIIVLIVPGLVGLLYLPDLTYRIWAPYQTISEILGSAFAAWCVAFGWLLLIGSMVAQLWIAPWRLVLWVIVIAHNLSILFFFPYWPLTGAGIYLMPVFMLITSGCAAVFDALSMA